MFFNQYATKKKAIWIWVKRANHFTPCRKPNLRGLLYWFNSLTLSYAFYTFDYSSLSNLLEVAIINKMCSARNCRIIESHEWAIQFNVLIKSVNIVSKHPNEPMMVDEALIIVRKNVPFEKLRCVIRTESSSSLLFSRANDKVFMDRIWRIKCSIPAAERITLAENFLIAVVDYE